MVLNRALNTHNESFTIDLTKPLWTKRRPRVCFITSGNPKNLCRNFKILIVVGLRRKFASGQLLSLSIDTIRHYRVHAVNLRGPKKSMKFYSFIFTAFGNFSFNGCKTFTCRCTFLAPFDTKRNVTVDVPPSKIWSFGTVSSRPGCPQ